MTNGKKYIVCAVVMLGVIVLLLGITKNMNRSNNENKSISLSTEHEKENKLENSGTTDKLTIENLIDVSEELLSSEEQDNSEQQATGNLDTAQGQAVEGQASAEEKSEVSVESKTEKAKEDIESGVPGEGSEMSATTSDTASHVPNDGEKEDTSSDVKKIVAIDAGHQRKGNSEKEPNGPGSSVMKAKVSQGTSGIASKVAEYVLNLDVSIKLKEELINRGYEVIMIRETHDVNISNAERAAVANESADIFLRIHANGSDDSGVTGALTIYPSKENEYVGFMSAECKKLSEEVIHYFCAATDAKNRGAIVMDNMSGINWCTIPVTIIEMGYMSNPEEDKRMQTAEYQKKIVKGIADGVDSYFAE